MSSLGLEAVRDTLVSSLVVKGAPAARLAGDRSTPAAPYASTASPSTGTVFSYTGPRTPNPAGEGGLAGQGNARSGHLALLTNCASSPRLSAARS
jgi:hypothetical protein